MHPGLAFPSEPSCELASSPGVLVGSLPREVKGDPRLPTLQTVSPQGPTLAFVPSAVHGTCLMAHLGAPCWPGWGSQPSLVYSPPLSCRPTGSTGHGLSHRYGGVPHFAPCLWLSSPSALWSAVLNKGPPHPGLRVPPPPPCPACFTAQGGRRPLQGMHRSSLSSSPLRAPTSQAAVQHELIGTEGKEAAPAPATSAVPGPGSLWQRLRLIHWAQAAQIPPAAVTWCCEAASLLVCFA